MAVELVMDSTKKEHRMSKLGKWLMIAAIVSVSCGVIVAIMRLIQGEGKFFYTAKFTEFFVCEGPDPNTGLPKKPTSTLPSSVEAIYACGYLEASGKVPLFFLLFYEGQPTGWFDHVQQYQTGYVFQELPRSWRKPGDYRVEVRLQRHLLASAEFTLVP
jgi:hypothetical protein